MDALNLKSRILINQKLRRPRLEEKLFWKTAEIIHSFRGDHKLKDILAVVDFPKVPYMHLQNA